MITITVLEMKNKLQVVDLVDFIYSLTNEQSNHLLNLISNMIDMDGIILTHIGGKIRYTTLEKYKKSKMIYKSYIIIQKKQEDLLVQLKK